ncbi:PAS domain-containing protein [Bacillus daqingensis]|uniref:PAS domain-containing protein n=1 Tax=Bacillus daqingensis TaxID=872396 RepID=A0ABV9P273_9BACI
MTSVDRLKEIILDHTSHVFLITDPKQPDNPIIYANDGFYELTGYTKEEVIGQNCRFLQGPDTDRRAVAAMRRAIEQKDPFTVELLNYRKNGTPFWNLLHIDPVYVEDEGQYYFVGIQKDITDLKDKQSRADSSQTELDLLSTPIVPITASASVLPLIGQIDERRLEMITERLTTGLADTRVETLILDLTGFQMEDEGVADSIIRLGEILQLQGIELIVTGITPETAMKYRKLDQSLSNFRSFHSVKQAYESLQQ